MSTTTTQTPVPTAVRPVSRQKAATSAYAALTVLYLAAFGYAVLEWSTLLLYTYGWFPVGWEQIILDDGPAGYIDGSAIAWLTALIMCAAMIVTGPRRLFADRSPRWRACLVGMLAALALPALWAGWQATMLDIGDLWWRVIQLAGVTTLIAAVTISPWGPSLADLGIRRRAGHHDAAGFHTALRRSLLGVLGATVLGTLVIVGLHPRALAGPVGAGSGEVDPWWYWALAYTINAVVEEGVCTAWLFALLHRAGRPRWEIYTVAAALRILFHLYMGLAGIAAAVIAVVNIRLFERTGRLIPLVAAHALYDTATGNGNTTVTLALMALALAVLLLPSSTLPRIHHLLRRGPRAVAD